MGQTHSTAQAVVAEVTLTSRRSVAKHAGDLFLGSYALKDWREEDEQEGGASEQPAASMTPAMQEALAPEPSEQGPAPQPKAPREASDDGYQQADQQPETAPELPAAVVGGEEVAAKVRAPAQPRVAAACRLRFPPTSCWLAAAPTTGAAGGPRGGQQDAR
jgi:hypothetical protein